jgi:hypothetical protein
VVPSKKNGTIKKRLTGSWRDFQSVFSVIRITKISAFSGIRIRFGIRFGIQ